MEPKKLSSDACQWACERYIDNDPDLDDFMNDVKIKADLAGQIYSVRNKLRMTREDLAEFSGLSLDTVEALEESDYDGSWQEAINLINSAFENWYSNVILPASRMTHDDYSIKALGA